MQNGRFLVVDWDFIYEALFEIAEKVQRSGIDVRVIIGILRGGWVPARVLSDLLSVSEVGALEIKFYRGVGERWERPVVTQPLLVNARGKEVLIIDDVADTGKSLQTAVNFVSMYGAKVVYTATIFVKPWSTIKPDFFVAETDKWVVFPWEVREVVEEYVRAAYKVIPRGEELMKVAEEVADRLSLPRGVVERVLRLILHSKR